MSSFDKEFKMLRESYGIHPAKRIIKEKALRLFYQVTISYLFKKKHIDEDTKDYLVRGLGL